MVDCYLGVKGETDPVLPKVFLVTGLDHSNGNPKSIGRTLRAGPECPSGHLAALWWVWADISGVLLLPCMTR